MGLKRNGIDTRCRGCIDERVGGPKAAAIEASMNIDVVCIDSHQSLKWARGDRLCSENTGREYPVVSGIPILVDDPYALLHGFHDAWKQMKAGVGTQRAQAQALFPQGLSVRLERRLSREEDARRENLNAIAKYLAPLESVAGTDGKGPARGADLMFANGPGWSMDKMLPYFAQDWTGSPDFAAARDLITSTIGSHAPDRESIVVLGAGACGTVRAVADLFDATCGVDLSLPTLLLARGVLAGDDVVLRFEEIDWKPVQLLKAALAPRPIDLLVADVNQLPFKDGELSVAVTQYLMDLMVDPVATAREIHRVLKPAGIWINFSNRMRIREEPLPYGVMEVADIAPIFEPVGFDAIRCDEMRFMLLSFAHLDPAGIGLFQKVHHIVLRKRATDRPAPEARTDKRLLSGPSCWDFVPRRVAARAVEIGRVKIFGSPHDRNRFRIGVNGEFVEASGADADFFDALMSLIDGHRSLDGIYQALTPDASGLTRETFLAILSSMHNNFGVVDFRRR